MNIPNILCQRFREGGSHPNQGLTPNASTLKGPRGIHYDGTKLYISDAGNNRVLIFNSVPTANGANANVVVGQPDMSTNTVNTGGIGANTLSAPWTVTVDGEHLYIGDFGNVRVLVYSQIPITNGTSADAVIG